jgi:hypothetical protein
MVHWFIKSVPNLTCVTRLPKTSYDPVVSNTQTSAARILNSLHLQKHCVASGKLELNVKQYSKSYTH